MSAAKQAHAADTLRCAPVRLMCALNQAGHVVLAPSYLFRSYATIFLGW